MSRRLLVSTLWLLVGWVLGAAFAWMYDLSGVVAPIAAALLGALVAWDPNGWAWRRPAVATPSAPNRGPVREASSEPVA